MAWKLDSDSGTQEKVTAIRTEKIKYCDNSNREYELFPHTETESISMNSERPRDVSGVHNHINFEELVIFMRLSQS